MSVMATNLHEPLLTVDEFMRIDFGPEKKAELSNGVIRMMAGGTERHNWLQRNVLVALTLKLRGSGCGAYGSDMGVRTYNFSLRYPDVSVFRGRNTAENENRREFDDPRMIVEILSPSTRKEDIGVKLPEYKNAPTVETILYIDPDTGGMQLLQRTGPKEWRDAELAPGTDVPLPGFGLTLRYDEIFARD